MNRKSSGAAGRGRRALFCACVFLALALGGCAPAPESPVTRAADPPVSRSEDPLFEEREAKDSAFRSGAESPIPAAERAGFPGLSYYPVDPALRFSVRLHRYEAAAPVRMGTNTGEVRDGLRYGWFEFRAGGRGCRLEVFRLEEAGAPFLFIPFRDATSGNETYGAGRYVELAENTSGIYDLDFNRAYNPYCAYDIGYSCPLPPMENTLAVPIRAGEKKYRAAGRTGGRFRPGAAKMLFRAPEGVLSFFKSLNLQGALWQIFPQISRNC